jgi:hypothetical protein
MDIVAICIAFPIFIKLYHWYNFKILVYLPYRVAYAHSRQLVTSAGHSSETRNETWHAVVNKLMQAR